MERWRDVLVLTGTPVSFGQAARMLNLSRQTVHQLVKRGELQATPTPLGGLIDRDDLLAFKEKRERETASAT